MFEQVFKSLDELMFQEPGCNSELDYAEQSSWMLFLKYLDDLESERILEAQINNENYNITKCFQKNTNLINPIYKKKFLLIDSDDDTGKAKKDKFKCKRKEVEVKKVKKMKKE